jgi:hypothetical protein
MLRDAKKMFGNWRNVKRIKGFIVRNVQRWSVERLIMKFVFYS